MNGIISLGKLSLKNKVTRAVWNIVYALLYRPFGTELFWWWRKILLKLFGAKIGKKAYVYASANIWAPWNLKMGYNACIGPHVICYNQAMVELYDNACVSQYVSLCTAGHNIEMEVNPYSGLIVAPITIHKDAWIGMRAFIGMGVDIGEGAIVGATASTYKDVEPWTVVGGNPAKFVKKREIKE